MAGKGKSFKYGAVKRKKKLLNNFKGSKRAKNDSRDSHIYGSQNPSCERFFGRLTDQTNMSSSEDEGSTLVVDESAAVAGTSSSASDASRSAIDERALRDVHFVSLVRGYEELYNRAHPRYDDRRRRRAVWQEIATIVNESVEDCKKRWDRMRKNYVKSVHRARRHGSEPARRAQRPAHEQLMSFLDTSVLSKEQLSSIVARTAQHSGRDAAALEPASSSDDEDSWPVAARSPAAAEPDDDEDVNFFVQLAESIVDFPEAVRIHVKREAFRIVTDAEEMLYHSKLRGLDVAQSDHNNAGMY